MVFKIPSNRFTYNGKTRTFISEASNLNIPPGMNIGSFYIRSVRTGAVRLFLLNDVERDATGEDVLAFHYISPGQELHATIFND